VTSDYLFLMESRLSLDQAKAMQRVQSAAESLGVTLYLVGGAIRDLICGFAIEDLDFVVEGKAPQVVRALGKDVRVLWQSDALQAAEVEFSSGVAVSISMARTEVYSPSGALSIAAAPILFDLRRRDFSINALGVSLNAQSKGLLLDPNNGAGDIEHKEIRVLHKRSFLDDPVRMLRAVRFRTRLQFSFEQKTAALYQAAKDDDVQQRASGEGLAQELRHIARERNPSEVLKSLEKETLLQVIHPRLAGNRINYKGIGDAAKISQAYAPMGIRPPSLHLFLHLLIAKLPPRDQAQIFKRLNLAKTDLAALRDLESEAKRLQKELMGKAGSSPTALFKLLSATPSDLMILLLVESPQAKVQSRVKVFLQKYLPMRLQLPSHELAQLGVEAGTPRHTEILDAYFYGVLEGKVRGKGDHTKFLSKLIEQTQPKPAKSQPPRPAARPIPALKLRAKPAPRPAAKAPPRAKAKVAAGKRRK
jgi:tRNA nucleotidyltransferase (CCA-adding enzyme)